MIKHYEVCRGTTLTSILLIAIDQQYNEVKDKLRDLVPWVEKLLVTLAEANSDNDLEEAERRSQLEKSVPSLASLPPPHEADLP